jgi:hypothetical protein
MSTFRTFASSIAVGALLFSGFGVASTASASSGTDVVVPRYDSFYKPQRLDGAKLGVDSVTLDLSALTTQRKERVTNPDAPDSPIYHTGWISWKAQKSGTATFVVYDADFGGPQPDTTLALYTGSTISKAKRVAFNDDADGGLLSRIADVSVKKGRTYHLQVGVPSATPDPVGGSVSVAVFANYAPANDRYKYAQKLRKKSGYFYATLNGATVESWETGTPDVGSTQTVWYSFTAPADGVFTLSPWREIGTDYGFTSFGERVSIAAYLKGSTLPPVAVPITDNTFAMTKGSTYLIQVGNLTSGALPPVALAMISYSVQYTSPWISSITPTRGKLAGGYEMTITGEGFDGTTDTVRIGGRSAVVVSDSTTSIVVTVPKGKSKRSYAVIVNGVSNSVSFRYQ